MGCGCAIRLAFRVFLLLVAGALVYIGFTALQVWDASNDDTHQATDAIIVLGAAQYDGRPSPVLRKRLDHVVELYQEGIAPTVVVTGGKKPGDRYTEAAASFRYLREQGIPEEVILREEQGSNTWEQLAAATTFLRLRGIGAAVLVSDDYHAYRLERIAGELGLDVQVSPVDPGLSVAGEVKAMTRETVAVAAGRIIGFRRLVNLDHQL